MRSEITYSVYKAKTVVSDVSFELVEVVLSHDVVSTIQFQAYIAHPRSPVGIIVTAFKLFEFYFGVQSGAETK